MNAQFSQMVPDWYRPRQTGYDLLKRAARVFGLHADEIKGTSRARYICVARWALMTVLHEQGWSSPRIGRFLGNRDHTTVLNGLARARELMAADPEYAVFVARVAG